MNIRVFICLALLTLGVVGCGDNPTMPRPPEPPTVYPPPPEIRLFEISGGRDTREPGERLQLNWVIRRVKWVNLDDGTKIIYTYTAPTMPWGQDEVTNAICKLIEPGPMVTTTYTLTAKNDWGTVKASLVVKVK